MSTADAGQAAELHERLLVELRRLDWASELSEEALQDIAANSDFLELRAGDILHRPAQQITSVYFIVSGRLDVTLVDRLDKAVLAKPMRRGSVLGLFSVASSDQSHLLVEVAEPTTVIRLDLARLLRLASKHAEFQLALLRLAAGVIKQVVTIDRDLPRPGVVGVVHQTDRSRALVVRLVQRLRELGETPCVAGDDARSWSAVDVPFRLLFEQQNIISAEERKALLQEWSARGRLFIDLQADRHRDELARLLSYADSILWCMGPQEYESSLRTLRELLGEVPRWRDKIHIVWLLENEKPHSPYVADLGRLASHDFKVTLEPPTSGQSSLLHRGIERIVHHLRGIRIGLALGGGAARGMAHLGVLKALEENGIAIDMLAGTSAGAMTGTIVASGISPDRATQCFRKDLRPPWFLRRLPGGGYWYLLLKYRRRQFGPMLRKYLDQLRMEQLVIPMATISVDLVEGETLVRDSGDATNNILESINLPPLALPIVGSGRALVDGGLLNNIPANVLVSKGCNFVIASSVTAKLEKDFMNIRSMNGKPVRKLFSTIPVILRQQMIQSFSMNAVGVSPADFVIAPDVTAFDISEFTRADEMAVIGEQAGLRSMKPLRTMLSKLDSKLFPEVS